AGDAVVYSSAYLGVIAMVQVAIVMVLLSVPPNPAPVVVGLVVFAVYANDLTKPIMQAKDKTFGAGYVGFGSFDDTGRFSKVRLWAAEAEDKAVGHFRTKQKSD
ncbi:MAG: hypothetical protein R3236_09415, partial [Phycisphaeraceae bacterium]|nr:hypothetical protein [Phycisphaeraceae bacterium]